MDILSEQITVIFIDWFENIQTNDDVYFKRGKWKNNVKTKDGKYIIKWN